MIARVSIFVAVTFALSWACQTPAILALREGYAPPDFLVLMMAVGSAGPSLVALWFNLIERRKRTSVTSVRFAPSATPLWQLSLIALCLPVAAHGIGSAALYSIGLYRAQHWVYLPLAPEQIAIAIIAPIGEEFGWRGYALPRLQTVLSPLAASASIGLAWALWHVPTFFVPAARGSTPFELCMYLVAFMASSIIYTWLFNAGRGSLRGPLLAHLGIHLDNVFRASTLGDGVLPLASTTAVLTLMAVGLVWTGRLRADTAVVLSQSARPALRSVKRGVLLRRVDAQLKVARSSSNPKNGTR